MIGNLIHGGDVYSHPGVIDFSANMNPLGPPDEVIRAVRESAAVVAQYPDPEKRQLAELTAAYEDVEPDQIIFGNGAAELIFLFLEAVSPERVLLTAPSFAEYERACRAAGCEILWHYLKEEEDFRITGTIFESLDRLTPGKDAVILCQPNNPTGSLMGADMLNKIIDRCRERRIRLMLDECFLDLSDVRITASEQLKRSPEFFILKAFTKTFAMAGLRLGYGMTRDAGILTKMEELVQPWNVSVPAQMAGAAAVRDPYVYLERSRRLIRKERTLLSETLENCGFRVFPSSADFLFFRAPENLYEELLGRGFLIRDCRNYRGLEPGFFRIAVKNHEDNMALIQALNKK
ncbi:MAG: threonine-phosphate decarboxylase [Eubacteriales bacterium]